MGTTINIIWELEGLGVFFFFFFFCHTMWHVGS